MADVNDALAATRAAVIDSVEAAERSAATWTTPRDAGEMVAEPGSGACGPLLGRIGDRRFWGFVDAVAPPAFLRLVGRLFFYRILKKDAFPKGFKANKAMNPTNGPATLAEASRPPGEGARQVRPGMS
jgi:hypothetical protein